MKNRANTTSNTNENKLLKKSLKMRKNERRKKLNAFEIWTEENK